MSEPNQVLSLKPIPHPRHCQPLQVVITTEDSQPHLLPALKQDQRQQLPSTISIFFSRGQTGYQNQDLLIGCFKVRSLRSCVKPLPEPIFPPTSKERLTAVFISEPFILKTTFLPHNAYKTLINWIQMFVGGLKSRKKIATIHGQLKKKFKIQVYSEIHTHSRARYRTGTEYDKDFDTRGYRSSIATNLSPLKYYIVSISKPLHGSRKIVGSITWVSLH